MPGRLVWLALALCTALAVACGPTTPAAPQATAQAAAGGTQPTSQAVQPTSQGVAQPTSQATQATGPQVRITLNQEPDTLNPFYSGLRATFTVTQAIFNGLVVVNEMFCLGIPLQGPVELFGNSAKEQSTGSAVSHIGVADRLLTRADALEEISGMALGMI